MKPNKDNSYKGPLASIVIINYNGKRYLLDCLTSIQKINYVNKEIILVDNASSDGSVELVHAHFPDVIVISLKVNTGFTGGANVGARAAKGEYITILNEDMKVHEDFLNEVISFMKGSLDIAICGSLLLSPEEKYDGRFGFKPVIVFAVGGGAMTVRRDVIEAIGLFDEDYFLYDDDVDFCWRAWMSGNNVFLIPKSVIIHFKRNIPFHQRINNRYVYFFNRNRIQTLIKNLNSWNLFKAVPCFIVTRLIMVVPLILIRRGDLSIALLKSLYWNLTRFKRTWRKRLYVQSLRKVSDNFIKLIKNVDMGSVFSPIESTGMIQKFFRLRDG